MKLKRPVVVRRYAHEIDRFYREDVSLPR